MSKPHFKLSNSGAVMTTDGLQNVIANLGTGRDKRSHNQYTFSGATTSQNFVELEAAYQDSWLARMIVNAPVDDATREWRTFDVKEAEDIARAEKRIGLQQAYQEARYWARLYGGSIIMMMTDQDPTKPLDLNRIKKGSLKRLLVLDRWDVTPQNINYNDPTSPSYLKPEFYTLVGGSTRVHHSHIVRLDGEMLPRRLRGINNGWGDSILRKVLTEIKDMDATKGGIASMVLEANIDTITKQGLYSELSSGEDDAITKRYMMFGMMKSLVNLALLDGDEKLERNSLSFSGLSDIFGRFMEWVSGASGIPQTRLFGTSAQGMNATGEGDAKNYNDTLRSMQESRFRCDLEQIDEVMVRSALGYMPDEMEFEWNPLYQESGVEQAQQALAELQSDEGYVAMGVVQKSQIMRKLQAVGKYGITDDQIAEQEEFEKEQANGLFDPTGTDDPFAEIAESDEQEGEEAESGEGNQES